MPKPVECAIFYSGRWFVWRIDGSYMLYERRPFKARRTKGDRLETMHHDFVACCPITSAHAASFGIDSPILTDARNAAHFHKVGIT